MLPAPALRLVRATRSGVSLLVPRRSRSLLHGYLFDRRGGLYQTEGLSFEVPRASMPRSYRSRFYFDLYEAPERQLVQKYVQRSATVLELGGCIGVVSCVTNRLLERSSSHVVVEANPDLVRTLEVNRDRNDRGFHIEQCIVSRQTGDTVFPVSPLMTASRIGDRLGRPVVVQRRSIDDLQAKYGLRFDVLIADIEGGELDLLDEHADLLSQFNVVILEVHPSILGDHGARRVREILLSAGLTQVEDLRGTEVWLRSTPLERHGRV